MKKILLIMGVVISSAIGFADAKTDYTNAENLAKNNKITESVKLLESVSNHAATEEKRHGFNLLSFGQK